MKIGDEWSTFPQNSNSMMLVLKEVNSECAAKYREINQVLPGHIKKSKVEPR